MCDKDRVDVSVIVPTCNRSSRLATLLDDLSHQRTGCAFEVLVVDNASVDDTGRVVERWRAQDRRIHYLLEPRRGASRRATPASPPQPRRFSRSSTTTCGRRQTGLRRCIVAFELHPDLDCLGGRIEPRWPVPPPSWLTSAHWGPLALQMGRGASSLVNRLHVAACLVTANFALPRGRVPRARGFAPEYLRDEDREFNLRMWRAGKRGMYVDRVVTFTEIQRERLEKRYHRAWHRVTGASHARMRYATRSPGTACSTMP